MKHVVGFSGGIDSQATARWVRAARWGGYPVAPGTGRTAMPVDMQYEKESHA